MIKLGETRDWEGSQVIIEPNSKDLWQYRIVRQGVQVMRSGFKYKTIKHTYKAIKAYITEEA